MGIQTLLEVEWGSSHLIEVGVIELRYNLKDSDAVYL